MLSFLRHEPTLKPGKISPVVLVVLDGWGVGPASSGNAITTAKTPNMNSYYASFPNGVLLASGESVGLPADEVGNTEVGHLNLGAGRVVLQDLKRINKAIEEGTFFERDAFLQAANHVRQSGGAIHLMGLVGRAGVHSSLEHLIALLEFCKKEKLSKVYLHLFTDGRDSPPNDAAVLVEELETRLVNIGVGKIASVTGRYWAMDRDSNWDRIETTYDALVSGLSQFKGTSARQLIEAAYERGETDEFIKPSLVLFNGGPVMIADGDSAVFFNYRIDRPRELSMAFTIPDFENLKTFSFYKDPSKSGRQEITAKFDKTFTRKKILQNFYFVSMTLYDKKIPVSAIAFPPEEIKNGLAETLSRAGLAQMHMSESEKERFVTYYFDGQYEKPFPGEDTLVVQSPKVHSYDQKPQMSLSELTFEFKKALSQDKYNFLLINIANPDMVAHSGNFQATVKAIEIVDKYIGEIVNGTLAVGGRLIITGDHGNAEELLSFVNSSFYFTTQKGNVNTQHSKSPVPLLIIAESLRGKVRVLPKGMLNDVAPTILTMLGIEKPQDMTGRDLLQ